MTRLNGNNPAYLDGSVCEILREESRVSLTCVENQEKDEHAAGDG